MTLCVKTAALDGDLYFRVMTKNRWFLWQFCYVRRINISESLLRFEQMSLLTTNLRKTGPVALAALMAVTSASNAFAQQATGVSSHPAPKAEIDPKWITVDADGQAMKYSDGNHGVGIVLYAGKKQSPQDLAFIKNTYETKFKLQGINAQCFLQPVNDKRPDLSPDNSGVSFFINGHYYETETGANVFTAPGGLQQIKVVADKSKTLPVLSPTVATPEHNGSN
jgi:hypothetical protein